MSTSKGEQITDTDMQCIERDFEEWALLPPNAFALDKDGDGEYESYITKRAYQCFEYAYTKGMWGAGRHINDQMITDGLAKDEEIQRLRNTTGEIRFYANHNVRKDSAEETRIMNIRNLLSGAGEAA